MNLIKKINNFVAKIEQYILIVLLVIMLALGFFQVVLRNFGSGISWADVYLRHSVLWVGLIGASLATKSEKHINMDALSRVLPENIKSMVSVFINLVAAGFVGFFSYAGYLFVKDEYLSSEAEALFLGIPAWVVQSIIPVAFFIISIRFIIKALEKISELTAKESENS